MAEKCWKYNPKTKEHDIRGTWVDTLKLYATNDWIPKYKRDNALKIADSLTEEEAEKMCNEFEEAIKIAVGTWRMYQ
jgi:mRNA-degrading endonuclease YafQ of YafQ-DinJ toxin-antitoxin module